MVARAADAASDPGAGGALKVPRRHGYSTQHTLPVQCSLDEVHCDAEPPVHWLTPVTQHEEPVQ